MIRKNGVNHSRHGDNGEKESGDESWPVAKVQHANCESSEDDGEVQPREERSLVGEEDFGFDTGGKSDTFACIDSQLDCFYEGL